MKIVSTVIWKDYLIPTEIFVADFKEAFPKIKKWGFWDLSEKVSEVVLYILSKIETPRMDTAQSKEFINRLSDTLNSIDDLEVRTTVNRDIGIIKECIEKIVENRKNEVPFNLNTKTVEQEIKNDSDLNRFDCEIKPFNKLT